MVHHHILADGEIEFTLYHQGVGQVPGKYGITFYRGQRTCAPAFITDRVFIGNTQRERRVLVEKEIGAMVVVQNDGVSYPDVLQPGFCRLITVKQGLPPRRLLLVLIESHANRRNVGRTDTGN